MPVLARDVGAKDLNKFYLEQALLAFSSEESPESKEKCIKLNDILNSVVRDEVEYGVYNDRIALSDATYSEIFAV